MQVFQLFNFLEMLEDHMASPSLRVEALEDASTEPSVTSSILDSADLLTSSVSTGSLSLTSDISYYILDWRSGTTPSTVCDSFKYTTYLYTQI